MYPRPEFIYSEASPVFTTAASLEDLLEQDQLFSSFTFRGQMPTFDDQNDQYWMGGFLPMADPARRFNNNVAPNMYNMADFQLASGPNADGDELSCSGTRTSSLYCSTVSFDVIHAATHETREPKLERRSRSLYEKFTTFWKIVQGRFNTTA